MILPSYRPLGNARCSRCGGTHAMMRSPTGAIVAEPCGAKRAPMDAAVVRGGTPPCPLQQMRVRGRPGPPGATAMTVSWRPVMLAKDLLRGDTTLHLQEGNGVKLGDVLVPAGEYERLLVVQVTTPTSFQVVRGQHRSRNLPVLTELYVRPEPFP